MIPVRALAAGFVRRQLPSLFAIPWDGPASNAELPDEVALYFRSDPPAVRALSI